MFDGEGEHVLARSAFLMEKEKMEYRDPWMRQVWSICTGKAPGGRGKV